MISEHQRGVIRGLEIMREDLQAQIMRIDLLILNAQSVEAQVCELENSSTDLTHREISAAELERSGIPVLGIRQRRSL